MKKIFILLLTVFLLTGCSKEKKLTCKIVDKSDDMTMTQQIVTKYKENKLSSAVISVIYEVNKKDMLKIVKKSSKESFKEYENYDGINFSSEEKNLKYNYSMNIDISKVSSTVRENFKLLNDDIVKVEDDLVGTGYNCN